MKAIPVLVLTCFLVVLVERASATTFAEFRKNLLSVNPGVLTPQCRKVFKNCSVKMFSLMSILDVLKQRWDEYSAIPCINHMLATGFPNFNSECSMSGHYGQSVQCMMSPEALAIAGKKNEENILPAFKCLIDNASP
ncbi:uncharacterized protein LOC144152204 isoform X2 [Haemaphysalis longicornis]